jgi:hypothetical protein
LSQNANFCVKFFGENIFKIITSVPDLLHNQIDITTGPGGVDYNNFGKEIGFKRRYLICASHYDRYKKGGAHSSEKCDDPEFGVNDTKKCCPGYRRLGFGHKKMKLVVVESCREVYNLGT